MALFGRLALNRKLETLSGPYACATYIFSKCEPASGLFFFFLSHSFYRQKFPFLSRGLSRNRLSREKLREGKAFRNLGYIRQNVAKQYQYHQLDIAIPMQFWTTVVIIYRESLRILFFHTSFNH